MSSNEKFKFYKNPARKNLEVHKPYVPQYQLRGIDPVDHKKATVMSHSEAFSQNAQNSQDNPRLPRPAIRQPYAEAVNSPIGRGRGPLPNVGNNIEQTWPGVDGEIIDDISIDPSHQMVDNNDYVSSAALGLPEDNVVNTVNSAVENQFLTENYLEKAMTSEHLSSLVKKLEEEEYLLMVQNDPICSGPLSLVQEQASLLIFGDHELYQDNPVSIDDILIIKRVKIKVGVFLE